MSSRPSLKVDYCSFEAARYAVEKWHYSHRLPPPPHNPMGVWEDGRFIGAVVFARGASSNLLKPYGLTTYEGAELVRVALTKHKTPVSRIVAIALKLLKAKNPNFRLIVSFADPSHGHVGGIYKAGGWVYAGKMSTTTEWIDKTGRRWHGRMITKTGVGKVFGKYRSVLKTSDCTPVKVPGKYRYLMPLDDEMRERIQPLSLPYPAREALVPMQPDSIGTRTL
jgi:hypothetical protein